TGCGTFSNLSGVLGALAVTPRRGNQAVGTDRLLLEAGDSHGLAGLGARAGECPVVLDKVLCHDEVVHEHLDIGEGGDERLRNTRDRGRFPAVDGDRPTGDVVGSNTPRVATAPRLGVSPRELLNLLPIPGHLRATLYPPAKQRLWTNVVHVERMKTRRRRLAGRCRPA